MRYFYNEKTGEYVGATNSATACPDGCGQTDQQPDNSGQRFDGSAWTDNMLSKKRAAGKLDRHAYSEKIAWWTDRQLQAAMMRANGEKLAILEAEKASRA